MEVYETLFWYINEEKEAPLGSDRYYPLMKRILINNGYMEKEYMKDSAETFFNYVIRRTCKDMNSLEEYYEQTIKVLGLFDSLYEEDKEKTMNINTEEFIKLLEEEN